MAIAFAYAALHVVALAGFLGFYWLEWLARRLSGDEDASAPVFGLHA